MLEFYDVYTNVVISTEIEKEIYALVRSETSPVTAELRIFGKTQFRAPLQ